MRVKPPARLLNPRFISESGTPECKQSTSPPEYKAVKTWPFLEKSVLIGRFESLNGGTE